MTGYSSYGGGYDSGYGGENIYPYVEEYPVAQGIVRPLVAPALAPVQPVPIAGPAPLGQPN